MQWSSVPSTPKTSIWWVSVVVVVDDVFTVYQFTNKKLLLIRLPVVVLEQLQLQAVLVCLNLSV